MRAMNRTGIGVYSPFALLRHQLWDQVLGGEERGDYAGNDSDNDTGFYQQWSYLPFVSVR